MDNGKGIPTRSKAYQQIWTEISFSHELLDIFCESDSVYKRLNPFAYNDEIAELEEELRKELWRLLDEHLNERQKIVVRLMAENKTQMEIAKLLKVNQATLSKLIIGNTSYTKRDKYGRPTMYGGLRLKMTTIAKKDERVNAILNKIAEIRESEIY